MAEKKIDEKLAELYDTMKKLHGLTDRTEAIEELAGRFAKIGEEQMSGIEDRMGSMCTSVLKSLDAAKTAPEKLAAAAAKLEGKSDECAGEIDEKLADMESRVSGCLAKLAKAVRDVDSGVSAAVRKIDEKIAAMESASPIEGLEEFKKKLDKRLTALETKNEAITESQTAISGALVSVANEIGTIKDMVAKIPLKRGIFG